MARTGVRFSRVAVLAVAGLTVLTAGRAGLASGGGDPYVVRPGDTLWEIAERQLPAGEDPRPLIEDIRRANELADSALVEGQTLLLP
ncbi:MAG TPA: LysM peptidoglycan-binding domain-containing protein [Actinomycetota bacterium]|nr:LysM peptidoglycan-binding domain-containing protein [Actinomycetota bacterium]